MSNLYKIIQNGKVADVVKNPRYITFLPAGHVAITDKANAKGIVGSDKKKLFSFEPAKRPDIEVASIEQISLEEFDRLQGLLNSNQEITADATVLSEAQQAAIQRLSAICKNKIVAGFTLELSDGEMHSFKLTTEDQLNLMIIENQIASGVESFIYHSTNQPCKVFNKTDMIKIVDAFKRHTLYHTTYFNAAKHYIKSLVNAEDIKLFTYGMDVSDSVKDPVLCQLLKNGEVY